MPTLVDRINSLATGIGNYIRDSVKPRLPPLGGSTDSVLTKVSGTDNDYAWLVHKTVQYSLLLGATPKRTGAPLVFTIADGDVTSTSMIEAWYSPIKDVAGKEYEDDAEFDYLDVRVIKSSITDGSFKVAISTRDPKSRINNQKTIMYRVQN